MKLLIAGAESPIGVELCKLLEQRGIDYVAPEPGKLDPRDSLQVARVLTKCSPDQVINLASFHAGSQFAIHAAEDDPEGCELINHAQPSVLAQACDHLNIPLVHLSTAYVFSGDKKLGYNELDVVKPAGVYGASSLRGEEAIIAGLEKYVILRTGWVFGAGQDEMIRRWVQEAREGEGAVTVLRRKFSPTPTEDVARVLLAIALQVDCHANVWGTYHYCGLETKRESEFVQHVLKLAAQHDESVYKLLDHLSLNLLRADPPEIANTTLATKKIFDTFGIKQRSWHGSLQALIKSLHKSSAQESARA
ncbi:MAG: sugar nucleotide-binding protein [Pseudomonadales bacterium]|nr:sugar nucleotide-binding protein [Pseudomonadales bacterium]MCP5358982.1 sugar nucleotide-binding protein [Pseudomonadales bacterium]